MLKPKWLLIGTVAAVFVVLLLNSFAIVTEGHIGVRYRFEEIAGDDLQPGLNFKIPFIERIQEVNIRNQVFSWAGDAYTRDTQTVNDMRLKVTYRYAQDSLTHLIQTVGIGLVEDNILLPNTQKIAKDAIGGVNAERLVQQRAEVQSKIQAELTEAVAIHGIIVTEFAIENISFDPAFEAAIQAKVIAEQDVERMRHKTEERRVEAEQIRIAAEAEATRITTEATAEAEAIRLIQEQIARNPEYIEYLKILEWNGVLPQVIGDGVNPFVVIGDTSNIPARVTPAPTAPANNSDTE
jgi:regulator of protease activity HflC (stomatin/prohibitin superfamily)